MPASSRGESQSLCVEEVVAARDPSAVRELFDRIAPRYDLANHLLSGGIDFWWRERAARLVKQWRPPRVLDLATGSGDLALAIKRKLPQSEVIGADFSPEMLAIARRKGLTQTVVADALWLPFADRSFETVTVAFGLRNMADWGAALRNMARVLTAGGHLLVLDFSLPRGILRPAYRFYLHRCLPTLAAIVTGKKDAYDYLAASIKKFPSGGAMTALIEANGFSGATALPLTGGIATIYVAAKANL
ncbi:MAG: ubiquinone/menaquinone biosynthesis methyltransferase [Chthoniobacterales bacterium]|nr:ubiquinone/menaquinone biosynthesis methyltransferase [Chthoniobacterales bacterium]